MGSCDRDLRDDEDEDFLDEDITASESCLGWREVGWQVSLNESRGMRSFGGVRCLIGLCTQRREVERVKVVHLWWYPRC